ncbi:MAG: sensor histidine kinase [Leptospirillia bacterium]
MRAKTTLNESGTLQFALSHSASELRRKVGELSLIRELSECAGHIENREALATRVTNVVQGALQVESSALFGRDSQGWHCLGGCALSDNGPDPRGADPKLLDQAENTPSGLAFNDLRNTKKERAQAALALRQGDKVVGMLVLTDADINDIVASHQELLAIVSSQVGTLLAAAWAFEQLVASNQNLETTLSHRTQALKEAQERLHQQEKLASLGQLVTGVSHEFNNRLVPILAYSQLIVGMELPQSAAKAARAIEKAARGSQRIVDDLLSFASPTQPSRDAADLTQLLEEVKNGFVAAGSGDAIRIQVEPGVQAVEVDGRQIVQVFHNLIKNALQAIEEVEHGHVLITARPSGRETVVVVEDNGSGIPDAVLGRIFEPFFTTKEVGQGTGLGLSLSYGLVQANGGTIHVESRNGIGTRFTVRLPSRDQSTLENPRLKLMKQARLINLTH